MSKNIERFHEIVEHGSLDELKQTLERGADVNAPGHCERTALMVAIDAKHIDKMRLLLDQGADPELTDAFNATALRHAVDGDFFVGVQLLLRLGVDRGYHPKYALKKIDYDFDLPQVEMASELRELLSEDEWQASLEETEQSMREMGNNPTVEPMLADVQSVEVLKLFLAAGDDLNLATNEVKREYLGLSNVGKLECTLADYSKHKSPAYGTRNPQRMDNPFWREMVKLGCNAYVARQQFNDPDPFAKPGAVWCDDRFGASWTQLPDGRFVKIGGEHEDYYDPDFYIYNDVVIHDGKGEFQIYGYPVEVFPPTDFHSATLVGQWIYIIGCIGYPKQRRKGRTPVYRLEIETWEIERVETSGDIPSWLHEHRAEYQAERNVIRAVGGNLFVDDDDDDLKLIPNQESFALDLSTLRWQKAK